jgi:predicted nucleotidyltransferase component of viral defense system
MIPVDCITEWRARTRWATDEQVEQDLVLSRALVAIFEDPQLADALALRGGTAIHKLHFAPARRYSNDIDLVQLRPGPFGPIMDRMRARLDTWLGPPRREMGQGVRLAYRFESEIPPVVRLKLKIETNTREHFSVYGTTRTPFAVDSRWWRGAADITTFRIEELLGTKLRALFQRRKGRDLFDLSVALEAGVDPSAIVDVFRAYASAEGRDITRAAFEENLTTKVAQQAFTGDVAILLAPGTTFDVAAAASRVMNEIVALLPGDSWTGPTRSRGGL